MAILFWKHKSRYKSSIHNRSLHSNALFSTMSSSANFVELERIEQMDELARCVLHDTFFSSDGSIPNTLLWKFVSRVSPENNQVYVESAVLRRVANHDDKVHQIGCDIARQQNDRLGLNVEVKRKKKYYCGFRPLHIEEVISSAAKTLNDESDFRFIFDFDGDSENGHVSVCANIIPTTKSGRATARTAAGMWLAQLCGPPRRHRCDCDADDEGHPFSLYGSTCMKVL